MEYSKNLSIKEIILSNYQNVRKGTEFVLKAISLDDIEYEPQEGMRKLGDLAFHIATLPLGSFIFTSGLVTEFDPVTLINALKQRLSSLYDSKNFSKVFEKSNDDFLNFYKDLPAEYWTEKTYTSATNPKPITYLQGFINFQNHLIQHRGSLFTYLKTLNIPVSMKQYFGIEELKDF
ncbi:MAG: DinB family protein [Candidatus Hodarchaeales archaeon]|jgi:uncharacterized damage-inducible protein DinB